MYLVFSFCIIFLNFFKTRGTELGKMVKKRLMNNSITGMINHNVNKLNYFSL